MDDPTKITNPLNLSADERHANAEREQQAAKREGLVYLEEQGEPGRITQYWFKHESGKHPEDYTIDDLHRPGNRPAMVHHNGKESPGDEGSWAEYYLEGQQRRTDGGPIECRYDARGNLDGQEWSGPRDDGGPTKIWTGRRAGEIRLTWKDTPTIMDKPGTGLIEEQELSAHARLRWEALKAKQGGVFWRPTTEQPETHRPGGVKAAAAAAAAKATEPKPNKPKTADRSDER